MRVKMPVSLKRLLTIRGCLAGLLLSIVLGLLLAGLGFLGSWALSERVLMIDEESFDVATLNSDAAFRLGYKIVPSPITVDPLFVVGVSIDSYEEYSEIRALLRSMIKAPDLGEGIGLREQKWIQQLLKAKQLRDRIGTLERKYNSNGEKEWEGIPDSPWGDPPVYVPGIYDRLEALEERLTPLCANLIPDSRCLG